jgi:hypothetical protein
MAGRVSRDTGGCASGEPGSGRDRGTCGLEEYR